MKPTTFNLPNTVYAKDQDEYLALPAHRNEDGVVTTCWEMTFLERIKALLTGRVYLQTWTFRDALQPQLLHVDNPLGEIDG